MAGFTSKFTAMLVAGSLITASSSAMAAATVQAASAPVATSQTTSPWLALGAMTSNASTAASAAAAAQGEPRAGPGFPPIPALIVILATIGVAVWIATKDNDGGDLDIFPPLSPD